MTRLERIKQAARVHGVRGPTPTGDYGTCCPFCLERAGKEDTSYKLRLNPNAYSKASKTWGSWYYCYRCEIKGSVDLSWLEPVEPEVNPDEPKEWASAPEGFEVLDTGFAHRPYTEYLTKRGVIDQARAVGVGVCRSGKYAGRVVIPMKDVLGNWKGFSARLVVPGRWADAPRYLYPKGMDRRSSLWGASWVPSLKHHNMPLYLVEGVFDALPLYPYGLASFGKNVTSEQLDVLVSMNRRIIVCLDGDAWQDGKAVSARLRARGADSTYCRLPPGKDPGVLGWQVKEFIC